MAVCCSDPNTASAASSASSGGVGSVAWPLHTASGHEYMELNSRLLYETDPSKVIGRAVRAKQCAFWSDYLPKLVVSTGKPQPLTAVYHLLV